MNQTRGQLIWLFVVLVACTVLPLMAHDDEEALVPDEAYRVYSAVIENYVAGERASKVSIYFETRGLKLDDTVVRRLYTSAALVEDFKRRNLESQKLEDRFRLSVPHTFTESQLPLQREATPEDALVLSAVGFNSAGTDALLTATTLTLISHAKDPALVVGPEALLLHRDPGGTWAIQKSVVLHPTPASAP